MRTGFRSKVTSDMLLLLVTMAWLSSNNAYLCVLVKYIETVISYQAEATTTSYARHFQ